MNFDALTTKAKNKACVGDTFLIENRISTVTGIGTVIKFDDGTEYPEKLFNKWMRIARQIKERRFQSDERFHKANVALDDAIIMRKEAKAIYKEKYKLKPIDYSGTCTELRTYIVLTGHGQTIKFYFSPTLKADATDLERSYKSLHGTNYTAFAYGNYIRSGENIALIGMNQYMGRNLSDARRAFAMLCLHKQVIDKLNLTVNVYEDMQHLITGQKKKADQLLSSPEAIQEKPKPTEKKHWSGLNGEIAQDQVDRGLYDEYYDDGMPF
jgi:hypothetical protein